jgi:DNA processing protein
MDLRDAVAVGLAAGLRRTILADWLEGAGSVEVVLERAGIPARAAVSAARSAREAADRAIRDGRRRNLQPVCWHESSYPPRLRSIVDPPPVLWVRGDLSAAQNPAVAVVGSRSATPYALEVAERLGTELAARGVSVISGLARGVDSAAHRGALDAGRTVAVLGCGADIVYPREHETLAAHIARHGALVSELIPGAPPRPLHFPLRNRIISGLSQAVVVVEASERSGSLITARCALEQGRDVMAVPGNILSGRSRGCHRLLKDGAKVVESADDILEELGSRHAGRGAVRPEPQDPVLALMAPGETYDLDSLTRLTGQTAPELLTHLAGLELAGRLERSGGGRFMRSARKMVT